MMRFNSTNRIILPLTAALVTSGILLAVFSRLAIAPFGDRTLAIDDAYIQYLDFFSYLERLLTGDASYAFSFQKGIGGNVWAVISYYLLSPLNLFLPIFNHDLQFFYNFLVLAKLSIAAATMAFYLEYRFNSLNKPMILAFAVSFGLMQYNLEQARNIMWLDSVYMFPLLLASIHYMRMSGRMFSFALLSGLTIIFNWYSALYTLLFVWIFALFETLFIFSSEENSLAQNFKLGLPYIVKVTLGIMLGIGLSAFVLFPTFAALSDGRGKIDADALAFTFALPFNLVLGLVHGVDSHNRQAALYIGDLAVAGFFSFFMVKNGRLLKGGIVLAVFVWLMLYFKPFFFIFSLLKDASSYWYRYGFLASFLILYIAVLFFSNYKNVKTDHFRKLILIHVFPFICLIVETVKPLTSAENLLITLITYAIIMFWLHAPLETKAKNVAGALVALSVCFGLVYHTYTAFDRYAQGGQRARTEYMTRERELANNALIPPKTEFFRVNMTRPFNSSPELPITANYNEGLAFGYNSIASYTSSPRDDEREFLNKLGYKRIGDNMNTVNLPILPADTLLGVRYELANIEVEGLRIDENFKDNKVYKNHFTMPLAFLLSCNELSPVNYANNPFEYTNNLYEELFHLKRPVYESVSHIEDIDENRRKGDMNRYHETLKNRNGNAFAKSSQAFFLDTTQTGAIYGYFDIDGSPGLVGTNDKLSYLVSDWLGVSVFYVPKKDNTRISLSLRDDVKIPEPQFYRVNEDVLKEASKYADQNAAVVELFEDNHIILHANAKGDSLLFTTIPKDKGWKIFVDDEKTYGQIIEGVFIGIPLKQGEHRIEFIYKLPGKEAGIICSLLSLITLLYVYLSANLNLFCRQNVGN
ncbi:MAG: YfhO family protein [Selenomonadaceae bacterium]|nr:YfhO family protein [Selenomonadaceae bacterium]